MIKYHLRVLFVRLILTADPNDLAYIYLGQQMKRLFYLKFLYK